MQGLLKVLEYWRATGDLKTALGGCKGILEDTGGKLGGFQRELKCPEEP